MKKVSYFVKLKDIKQINSRRWYVDEINMLQELGYDVKVNINFNKIPRDGDYYISWWAQTSLFSVLVSKLKRAKSIVIAGGSEVSKVVDKGGYCERNSIKRLLIRITLKLADIVVAVSEYNKKEIIEILGEKYSHKIEVLYHCVADEYFMLEQKKHFEDDKYLLMISGFCESNFRRKCVYEVVNAIINVKERFPNIKLVIVGACEDKAVKQKLQEYIQQKKVDKNIIIMNDVEDNEKIALLNSAYYYLQPTYHEQFGVAIAEAMASGCPVISTNVAAVPEVVGDTGILLANNEVKEIEKVILETYENDKLRNDLAVKSRMRARDKFTYAVKKDNFEEIIVRH